MFSVLVSEHICMESWNNVDISDNVATTFLNVEPVVSPSNVVTTEHDRCCLCV